MLGFWLILFAKIFYSRRDIFKTHEKKYGRNISNVARLFVILKIKKTNTSLYVAFIKSCKQEHFLSPFAKVLFDKRIIN